MPDFKAKMHQFDFRWGSAPDPAGGTYNAPQTPLLYLRRPTSKGRKEKEKEGKGRESRGENDLTNPMSQIPGYATL